MAPKSLLGSSFITAQICNLYWSAGIVLWVNYHILYVVSNIVYAVAISLLLSDENSDSLCGNASDTVGGHQHHCRGGYNTSSEELKTGRNHNHFHQPWEGLSWRG